MSDAAESLAGGEDVELKMNFAGGLSLKATVLVCMLSRLVCVIVELESKMQLRVVEDLSGDKSAAGCCMAVKLLLWIQR